MANKYPNIKALDDLTSEDLDNAVVLIASDEIRVYEEIRQKLYAKVDKNKCVEIFPRPMTYPISRVCSDVGVVGLDFHNCGIFAETKSHAQNAPLSLASIRDCVFRTFSVG